MTNAEKIAATDAIREAAYALSLTDLIQRHTAFRDFADYAHTVEQSKYAMTIRYDLTARGKVSYREAIEKQVMAERLEMMGYPLYVNGERVNY